MPEPWAGLKDKVFEILRGEVADFIDETKPELTSFLKDKAIEIAKEKWAELHAPTEAERDFARANLKHLKGHIIAEAAILQLATTDHTKELLKKVLSVAVETIIRISPVLLGI